MANLFGYRNLYKRVLVGDCHLVNDVIFSVLTNILGLWMESSSFIGYERLRTGVICSTM